MVTTGVLGGRWRATVTEWGAIEPWNSDPPLHWHIAADDRWHSPEREPAVRQARVEGTPVVETRVRIPNGDAIQRVYSVPDHGGLTIIEIENASPLAIAVAFTRGDLLSARPASAPIEGIDLPVGSIAFPVGHHATLTVALPHSAQRAGAMPDRLPPLTGVVRGWLATVERAGRMLLPDAALSERVVTERCELALGGPVPPDDDPVAFLLGVGQLVRMGEQADPWLPDLAYGVELAVKESARDWSFAAALEAADGVLETASDTRARADLASVRAWAKADTTLPAMEPSDPARLIAWVEHRLATRRAGVVQLLPEGLPVDWVGSNFEVYGVPTSAESTVSFAIRWHGDRPAALWEQSGPPVQLASPVLAPDWSSSEVKGETLWPALQGVEPVIEGAVEPPAEGLSFS
jgi:hypothetical protein